MGPGLYEAWGVERFTLRRMAVYLRLNRTSGDCLSPERTGQSPPRTSGKAIKPEK